MAFLMCGCARESDGAASAGGGAARARRRPAAARRRWRAGRSHCTNEVMCFVRLQLYSEILSAARAVSQYETTLEYLESLACFSGSGGEGAAFSGPLHDT